ncbi:small subunit of terminase [Enterococcus faecalis]|uniref:phage terminase small subunit n=1 Tax=Enterococcus faecalis TaxID=1351 RepID=UPI001A0F68F9|nr:phage terminase small subunit [Enterococcus faecalis]EGO5059588.1 small subunit of terminase [Enterococcus faecalis]EHB6415846.1 small subunit of terminase [Enterococcus faecalis]EHZ2983945.1 small subunit of terminase [Enterococcus faecalis]EKZ0092956.1 small subunit of terminase [Enterococcus faecalis]UQF29875.1 phage terminase small subunit [Enterococcus faecalis]
MDKKEQAKKYYEEGWKYKDISEKLSVPLNTLKSWRKRDKWERGGATKEVQPTNRGAPQGNQNAIGNKGNKSASPPKRNKNAVKTGEYETIFADMLSDEEKDIYSTMNDDPFFILEEEIRLLKVRQFRMMKRIKEAEKGLNDEEVERLQQLRKIKTPVEKDGRKLEIKREVMQDVQVTRKTFRKLDDILAIEDALTRVSNQLIKVIKQQKELLSTDKKSLLMEAQIEKIKLETDKLSGGSSNDEADSWKQAVINAANKRAVEENE